MSCLMCIAGLAVVRAACAVSSFPAFHAELQLYPGYKGDLKASGDVVVFLSGAGAQSAQKLEYDLNGVDASCSSPGTASNACGIHIHAGTACNDALGHHHADNIQDPWKLITYSLQIGQATQGSTPAVVTGLAVADIRGKTIVVHDSAGGRIACGQIKDVMIDHIPKLWSEFRVYPGYSGNLKVSGNAFVYGAGVQDTSQFLRYSLNGVDPLCSQLIDGVANACGIHVHKGKTCAVHADVEGHHYHSGRNDPWKTVAYTASGSASTGMTGLVLTGVDVWDLVDRALVVHDSTGVRIACGRVKSLEAKSEPVFFVNFGIYPEYAGDLIVSGKAFVQESEGKKHVIRYSLGGVDKACSSHASGKPNACGIHVHEGKTCETKSLVGGHYFEPSQEDPWKSTVYTSLAAGGAKAAGMTLPVQTGYSSKDLDGRALVVHDADGARVACGLLLDIPSGTVMRFHIAKYPGYSGPLSVSGSGHVLQMTTSSQVLNYDLQGSDDACRNFVDGVANACGIHIHAGENCADAGGHHFAENLQDPWKSVVYKSDAEGSAKGTTPGIQSGLESVAVKGRVVVVHDSAGKRIGCGVIKDIKGSTYTSDCSSGHAVAFIAAVSLLWSLN